MKGYLYLILFSILLLYGCAEPVIQPVICSDDAKVCSDGTVLSREGAKCEFPSCPDSNCNENRNYISRDGDECSRIQFLCVEGTEPFSDECGCGCYVVTKEFCTDDQRESDFCITVYDPVCGWSDPDKIQCVTYPCASTYGNSCNACSDENVLYWTDGECTSAI